MVGTQSDVTILRRAEGVSLPVECRSELTGKLTHAARLWVLMMIVLISDCWKQTQQLAGVVDRL